MTSLAGLDIAVLCGGMGSRIAPVLGDIPKALAPVAQSAAGPVLYLDWLFAKLKRHGATRVILLAGVHAEQIAAHLARHTPIMPVHIHIEARQEGTANAVRKARHLLRSDPVMIVNGDTLTNAHLGTFLKIHRENGQFASVLFAKPYRDTRPTERQGAQHAGFTLVPQWLIDDMMGRPDVPSLDDVLRPRTSNVPMTSKKFLDIGTPERLAMAPVFFESLLPGLT